MHGTLDEETLVAQLRRMGWPVERRPDSTLRSVHRTSEGEVSVYLKLSREWLVASVVPFLTMHGERPFELSRWLLRMNRDMMQSRFAYDRDGDVVLTVDLPTESLDLSEVQSALENLVRYALEHRGSLRRAAEVGAE